MAADVGLAGRLRQRRLTLGRTLEDVATSAGLSMQYLSNLERGRGNPTLDALQAIAAALDTTVAELLGGEAPAEGLDTAPRGLMAFTQSPQFQRTAERLARVQGVDVKVMRDRLVHALASAPRRSKGELTVEDWSRLLMTYELILGTEQ